ncbi:hypothetical protein [Nonomuraea sp. B5E05]|uniref:DUF6197 family protein n=1 Tax=Nonomuraea sp. B5E05 TaxID=3153569 RepID=UPI003260CE0E
MTTTPPAQSLSPAQQAKALLAYAADESRFHDTYTYDGTCRRRDRLNEAEEATATYAAQAATAHALLAVLDELRELRTDLRQAAAARREELPNLAAGVRELATALKPLSDIAESVDGLTDQVEAVRDEVEDGLATVASGVELLADRRRSRRWSRLWWPVRRRHSPSVADVRKRLIEAATPANPVSDALTRAAELLDREGWDPSSVIGLDVMKAVSRVAMSSPDAPCHQELRTQVWDAVVTHLDGQPLSEWQREPRRTQGQVVAMLREVAAKTAVCELATGPKEVDR